MSNELYTEISPEIINSLILTGDMSKLTASQQTQYYTAVCRDLGLNPLTQPFAIIVLQNKKTLYATKGCTQQLCNIRKINTEIKSRDMKESVYIVSVRATLPDGRYTDEDGVVDAKGLTGTNLANAMMKATTKAKRRAVLALCGLGMSDESEVEDIKGAKTEPIKPLIINDTEEAEVITPKPEIVDAPKDTPKEEPKVEKVQDKKTKSKSKSTKTDNKIKTLTVIGLIDNELQDDQGAILSVKSAIVDRNGTPTKKWSFLIGDKRYGTFDESLAIKIMDCVDNRRMVKFEFTERPGTKPGVILNDIVNFSEANTDEIKPSLE